MTEGMVVYWEYAFAENFAVDALLLVLSLSVAHAKMHVGNVLFASGVGAAEAIVFPLINLPTWAAYAVKFAGGLLIAVLAVRKGKFRTYCTASGAFFFLTFALGGLLTALYSFFGAHYEEGTGYIIEQYPIGLAIALIGFFFVSVFFLGKRFYRYRHEVRNLYACELENGGRSVKLEGLADTGNCLEYGGSGVCVVSPEILFALFGAKPPAIGRMTVGTVNGVREAYVFRAEKLIIAGNVHENVCLTTGEVKKGRMILHISLLEGAHEAAMRTEDLAATHQRKRKRRTLSLRKRGASHASFCGGRSGDAEEIGGR